MSDTQTLAHSGLEDDEQPEEDADLQPYDDDDDDEDPDAASAELEQPVEASAQANAADFEGKLKKLASSAQTFRRRVSDVLGEDALVLVPCELCLPDIPGFHFDLSIMQPLDETQARLLEILKTPGAPEYVSAPDVRRCDHCHGYGKGVTGSLVPGQETKVCTSCRGFGFVPPPGVDNTSHAPADTNAAAPDQGLKEDTDPWGSPRILPDGQLNPNYGRMPQYKEATLP